MALTDTWQLPAVDDIDSDSLEYLFSRKRQRGEAPWVKLVPDPEPVARVTPEMIRLQAKLETLSAQLEIYSSKLLRANQELGYVRAQLTERDQQLELQAEYRARAAMTIMSDVERAHLQERVADLEVQLREALNRPQPIKVVHVPAASPASNPDAPALLPVPAQPISYLAPRYSSGSIANVITPMPIIYLVSLTLAALVLLRLIT
jgi:hypothetical protein